MPGQVRGAIATAVLSTAVGASVFYIANHGPYGEIEHSLSKGPAWVKHQLGLLSTWGAFTSLFGADKASHPLAAGWDQVLDVFWVLVLYFKNMLSTQFGRGEVVNLGMAVTPLVNQMFIEALREPSNTPLLVAWFVLIMSIGQVITLGAALNILFIPWYAWYRLRQARQPDFVPRTPPPGPALGLLQLASVLFGGVAMLTTFLPQENKYWVHSNVAFQLSPLFFLPLVFWPVIRKVLGTPPASKKSHTGVIDLYWYLNVVVWFGHMYGMRLMWPVLKQLSFTLWDNRAALLDLSALRSDPAAYLATVHALAKEGGISSDGEWLLLFDTLGIMLAEYFVVAVDMYADGLQVERTKIQLIHPPRRVHEDWILSAPHFAFFGPGWLFSNYLWLRETASETASTGAVQAKDE